MQWLSTAIAATVDGRSIAEKWPTKNEESKHLAGAARVAIASFSIEHRASIHFVFGSVLILACRRSLY